MEIQFTRSTDKIKFKHLKWKHPMGHLTNLTFFICTFLQSVCVFPCSKSASLWPGGQRGRRVPSLAGLPVRVQTIQSPAPRKVAAGVRRARRLWWNRGWVWPAIYWEEEALPSILWGRRFLHEFRWCGGRGKIQTEESREGGTGIEKQDNAWFRVEVQHIWSNFRGGSFTDS